MRAVRYDAFGQLPYVTNVPDPDVAKLLDAGVAAVLTPGATADEVVETMRRVLARTEA